MQARLYHDKEGEDLDPPQNHQKAAIYLRPYGQRRKIGDAVQVGSRTDTGKTTGGDAHRLQRRQSGNGNDEHRDEENDDKKEKKAEHVTDDPGGNGVAVDLDGNDHFRMQRLQHFLRRHSGQNQQPDHAQAACGRADTAAGKNEKKEDKPVKLRPTRQLNGHKAARADKGNDVKKAVAHAVGKGIDAAVPEVQRHERTGREQQRHESAQLRIGEYGLPLMAPDALPIQQKIAAGQSHGRHGGEFQKDIVVMQEIKGAVAAARRDCHQSPRHRFERRQTGDGEERDRHGRKAQIDLPCLYRRRVHPPHDGAEIQILLRRDGHAESTADLGNDGDEKNEKIQPPHPFHQAMPEKERKGLHRPGRQTARAGRRIGRNALKKSVNPRQLFRHTVREHTDTAEQDPDENHIAGPFADADLPFMAPAGIGKKQPQSDGGKKGRSKIQDRRFPPPQGRSERNEQDDAVQQRNPAQQKKDDSRTHGSSLPLKKEMTFFACSVWMKRTARSPGRRTVLPFGICASSSRT